ncbi:MAG TPA: ABC transporter permease, partial [Bacteroidia bacterium]|nr:ABC transporter permease [Bacteroidia bacterium]
KRHLLGTGKRGEDVMSGLIYGSRVSLAVGFFSMLISGVIGIALGALAGYMGDATLKTSKGITIALSVGILPAWFYGFQTTSELLPAMNWVLKGIICFTVFLILLLLFGWLGKLISGRITALKKMLFFPVDTIITKVVELTASLPVLLLILIVASIAKPAISSLIWIIGLTSWTEITRLTRAEILRIRHLDYIKSARSSGISHWRIIMKHVLPNALNPAIIYLTFGAAGAILIESALSFLGVGVPPEVATWGGIIAAGKQNFSAWWMVLFPGMMLFMTVSSIYVLGMNLQKKRNPD